MIRPRIFINVSQNSANFEFNVKNTIKHTILRDASMVDEFYSEPCKPSHDHLESVSHIDPIYMLFNQERLNNLGQYGIEQFVSEFKTQSDPLAELRKKCSDEDLASLIKSKHLQSMSEITAWARYMNSSMHEFKAEVQNLIESQKKDSTDTEDSEPNSNTE